MNPELLHFVLEHEHTDINELLLSQNRYPQIDMNLAADLIRGRQKARTKLPTWYAHPEIIYPDSLCMEQCSSEKTARYKMQFVSENDRICDLTGGLGIDSYFLSLKASCLHYFERNPQLSAAAEHNFRLLQAGHIRVHHQELRPEDLVSLLPASELIYVDPARRGSRGNKVAAISDCEPDLLRIKDSLFTAARKILVKLSPMADISSTFSQLPECTQIHILSVNNECKELLFLLEKGSRLDYGAVPVHTVNFSRSGTEAFRFSMEEERCAPVSYTEMPQAGDFLYLPNRSLLKAGAFRIIGSHFQLKKIARHSHLYTAATAISDFPGKTYCIREVLGFSKEDLKKIAGSYSSSSVSAMNLPLSSEALKKKLKVRDGDDFHIFGTRLENGKSVLLVTVISESLQKTI